MPERIDERDPPVSAGNQPGGRRMGRPFVVDIDMCVVEGFPTATERDEGKPALDQKIDARVVGAYA